MVYPYGQPDAPVAVLDEAGSIMALSVDIGEITVTRPSHTASTQAVIPAVLTNHTMSNGITLYGYDQPATAIRTGEALPVIFYWRALETPGRDLDAQLTLASRTDASAVTTISLPLVMNYPSSQWQRGDLWRATHRLTIPPQLPTGQYTFSIQIDGSTALAMGTLDVTAPTHIMQPPSVSHTQRARFGRVAELTGFNLPPQVSAGQATSLTLIWKALEPTSQSYKVFVHFFDANGRLVASDDTIPAAWQRPTTSWISDEYIDDPHIIQIPADAAGKIMSVSVGLYDEYAHTRLTLPDGADTLRLSQTIEVTENQ
jgi:hypothetical protein